MSVPTRRFGKTEIQIPIFSCGGMRYQQSWERKDIDKVEEKNQNNLEATIKRSIELGLCHIETANGYGTSEYQLGKILPQFDRDKLIVQTKIQPHSTAEAFQADFDDSMNCLQLDHVELMGIHGINNQERLDWTLDVCMDRAREWKRQGRIKHIGFSTHGATDIIVKAIESGEFDYVNLHWYYFMQKNHPAVVAANKQDMGVFIISPSDKGGKLYEPTQALSDLCAPLSPMMFNDLFCLQNTMVHTISLGAARPSDFDEHLKIIPYLEDKQLIQGIAQKIKKHLIAKLGDNWYKNWDRNLPETIDTPGEVNVYDILRFHNLVKGLDMTAYGEMRYDLLGKKDHWFFGEQANNLQDAAILESMKFHIDAPRVLASLKEAHEILVKK